MALIYKTEEKDGKKFIEVDDKGLPIVVDTDKPEDDNTRQFSLDALHLFKKVPDLTNQVNIFKQNYEGAKPFISKLEEVSGKKREELMPWIESLKNTFSELETYKAKGSEVEGKIQNIKNESKQATEKARLEAEQRIKQLEEDHKTEKSILANQIHKLMISDMFKSSQFVKEKCAYDPIAIEALFSNYFSVEQKDGNFVTVGYKTSNKKAQTEQEKILSKERGYEPANFDECLERLIIDSPIRDKILLGNQTSGAGVNKRTSQGSYENPFSSKNGRTPNLTEQMKLTKENPELAARLKAEALRE